jgi:hypothetical protein
VTIHRRALAVGKTAYFDSIRAHGYAWRSREMRITE